MTIPTSVRLLSEFLSNNPQLAEGVADIAIIKALLQLQKVVIFSAARPMPPQNKQYRLKVEK